MEQEIQKIIDSLIVLKGKLGTAETPTRNFQDVVRRLEAEFTKKEKKRPLVLTDDESDESKEAADEPDTQAITPTPPPKKRGRPPKSVTAVSTGGVTKKTIPGLKIDKDELLKIIQGI